MKLHLLDRSSIPNRSLTVSHHRYSNFLKVWHFHEELELVFIIQSSGIRFVGDDIEQFNAGDLVLIGKNLPHMWLNDDQYFHKDSTVQAEAIAIHFKREFLGRAFFEIPEMLHIGNLLDASSQGIKFEDVEGGIIEQLKGLINLDATAKVVELIDILNQLAKRTNYRLLSSSGFINDCYKTDDDRLGKMYEYIFQNFNTPISSSNVAEVMWMNKSAFSRFFRRIHRKPFTRYLNEIRIGYACKLLLAGNESITSICYSCGFNNVSNFNRQFKLIKGASPSSYLQSHYMGSRQGMG